MNAVSKSTTTRPIPLAAAIRRSLYGPVYGDSHIHGRKHAGKKAALGAISLLGAPLALADPTGGTVVDGNAAINPQGNGTVINQSSQRAIIDWDTFNIGANEYVLFNQPGSSAVILNRVIGGDPSHILGNLTANGQVFLVNPNGVFFGANASLDVGGLLATTLDISNADFMAGNYHFEDTGSGTGEVSNAGYITARDGGYVVLAGDRVENSGVIAARAGHVVLAAGRAVTLDVEGDGLVNFAVDEATLSDLAGVHNAGSLLADGGLVLMTAKVASELVTTAVNNEGLVQAHGISEQKNGVILLTAEGGDIVNAGTLDADGVNGQDGGVVYLYGNENIDLKNGSVITASGNNSAAGGMVRVIAEDTLWFRESALIDATGAQGQGGFVEVSGHGRLLLRGQANIGSGGTFLIDPANLNIATGTGSPGMVLTSTASVGSGYISSHLNLGENVYLVASSTITADAGVSITATNTNAGDLFVGIGSISISGSSNSVCNFGVCYDQTPLDTTTPIFNNGSFGTVDLSGVSIDLAGNFTVEADNGEVTLGNVNADIINITGSRITTGDLSGSSLILTAVDNTSSFDAEITTGNLFATGKITLSASAGSFSNAGNAYITTGNIEGDTVQITATGSDGTSDPAETNITIGGTITTTVGDVSITANSGFIAIDGAGDTAIDAAGNVTLTASETIKVGTGTINFSTQSFSFDGRSINAGGDISMTAGGSYIAAGSLTAGGNINLDVANQVGAHILLSDYSNGNPTTRANVTAGGSIILNATASGSGKAEIIAGDISGAGVNITARTDDDNFYGASITAEDITATTGEILLSAINSNDLGGTSTGRATIDVGNLEAATKLSVTAQADGDAPTGGYITAGNVSAERIYIKFFGDNADITLGGITAINNDGAAIVRIVTGAGTPVDPYTQIGDIKIEGDITVAGQPESGSCAFGNTSGGASGCFVGPNGQPIGALVELDAGGSSGSPSGNVTIEGNINISATPTDVTVTNVFDGPQSTVSGVTGLAALSVQGADIVINGSLDIQGASAYAAIAGDTINISGAINAIALGGSVEMTSTGNYSDPITGTFYDVTTTRQGAIGNAFVALESEIGNTIVGGDITISGLVGRLDIVADSGNVNIQGISVTGTGGSYTEQSIYTTSGSGSGFTTSFQGSGNRNLVGIFGNNVTIDGNITITGAGLAGLYITGVANGPTINGDISVTATAASFTELDTRISPDPTTVTGGDAAVILAQFNTDGAVIGSADVNGSLTLTADTHAHLLLNADIRDSLIVNAGGRIDTVVPAYFQNPEDSGSLPVVPLSVTAGGLGLSAGGNIDFTSGTLTVDTTQDIAITAGGNVNLGTTTLTTTQLLSIVAGGSISNNVGSFTADGLAIISGSNINLGETDFTVGDGTFADIPGDELLLLGLRTQNLEPGSSSPNAYFAAGNNVTIGSLSVAGGYAWFETHDITFNGMVTGPDDLLVQFTPFGGEGNITISNDSGSGTALPPGLLLDLSDLQMIQDGATIAIGTSGYAGNVSIATVDIGARNFLTATSGDVNSLDNITTTGIVKTLSELIALTQFETPQIEEIDVNYGENEVGDKEGKDTDGDGVPDTLDEDSMIKHDTTEEGGVCKV